MKKNLLITLTAILCIALEQAQAQNTKFGTNALLSNTTGTFNAAFGEDALRLNTSGYDNTAIGLNSLYSNTVGNRNTSTGRNSLYANTTGSYNTSTGFFAMRNNLTGSYNTASGYEALFSNTFGVENTTTGMYSMYYNTYGSYNTANGTWALFLANGFNNTATGYKSIYSGSGSDNTANGSWAMNQLVGDYNTSIGAWSLYVNTKGSQNTVVGAAALYNMTSGDKNTVVGYNVGKDLITGTGNTLIGANIAGLPKTLSNTIILADGDGNQRLFIDNTGKARIGDPTLTIPGNYKLYVQQGILTEKVVVAVANSAQWADYVFDAKYKLMPLAEVAKYVKSNRHLPNVPSAADVVNDGLNLGAMNAKLLEKVEELTLYLIEQNSKNEAMTKELNALKSRVQTLETSNR